MLKKTYQEVSFSPNYCHPVSKSWFGTLFEFQHLLLKFLNMASEVLICLSLRPDFY